MTHNLKAKVFISCGQDKKRNEGAYATAIEDCLRSKGFDPYLAVRVQSPKGLKESIFQALGSSEYFLFVDFKRETLGGDKAAEGTYRGSLFSHQELAIAAFLELPTLAFQEEGVKQGDGILNALHLNTILFKNREELVPLIEERTAKDWKSGWKNRLVLARGHSEPVDVLRWRPGDDQPKQARFYFVSVRNQHLYKHARNCYVFLETVQDLNTGTQIKPLQVVEFKWSGYTMPNAMIFPSSARFFDGFYIFHDHPDSPLFSAFSDDPEHFLPRFSGPGDYALSYVVFSDNFAPARTTFHLHLASQIDDVRFLEYGEE